MARTKGSYTRINPKAKTARCYGCCQWKSYDDFSKRKGGLPQSLCRRCYNERRRQLPWSQR